MSALINLPTAVAITAQSILTHSHVSGANVQFSPPAFVQEMPPPILEPGAEEDQIAPTFTVASFEGDEWTRDDDHRFSGLAMRSALKKASPDELAELKRLQDLRRRTKCSSTLDEVLFQYERRQREMMLLNELTDYVQFLETARAAKA